MLMMCVSGCVFIGVCVARMCVCAHSVPAKGIISFSLKISLQPLAKTTWSTSVGLFQEYRKWDLS